MYETFFGMREPAFTLTPNPAFLYLNQRSREGMNRILYGIRRREPFALIAGDVGTGKTTLCWSLLEKLEERNVRTALVQNPMLPPTDFLKCILQDLGVRPKAAAMDEDSPLSLFDTGWMAGLGEKELTDRIAGFLAEMAHLGVFTVIIVDEAQNLSMETMERLRLLSDLELAQQKLVQIVFVGQLELKQMLDKPVLKPLNDKISVRFETKTLSRKDTEEYVRHRLRVARALPRLRFERRSFWTIYRCSKGYPRLINMICDRALLCSFQTQSYIVTPRMVRRGYHTLHEPSRKRPTSWVRRVFPLYDLFSPE